MICFESAFPHISRALRRKGAGLLVVITNDAWFGKTAAAEQHLQIGRFRAIEEGASVVRAAASGISCAILPSGRVTRRAELGARQALVVDVPVKPVPTAYRLLGPAFPAACLLVACLTALAAVLRKKARHAGRRH
jgi:apolipoprotein N-acyltransferase